jgi:hypothetical protein
MEKEKTKQIYETSIREKYPCYNYALLFLKGDTISQRKIGYSLLAPLFHQLPQELQEYIRLAWQVDPEKYKMPRSFVKCCEKIFVE